MMYLFRLASSFVVYLAFASIILSKSNYSDYLLLLLGLLWIFWPLLALYFAKTGTYPQSEKRNLLIDGAIIGLWIGFLGLPFWPLAAVAFGFSYYASTFGAVFAIQYSVVYVSAIALGFLSFSPELSLETNNFVATICITGIMIIFYFSGFYSYILTKQLNKSRQLTNMALKSMEKNNDILQLSSSSLDLEEIAQVLFQYIRNDVVDFQLLTIKSIDHKKNCMHFEVILSNETPSFDIERLKKEERPMNGELLAEQAIASQRPQVIQDIESTATSSIDKNFQKQTGLTSVAIFPYMVKDRVLGVVSLYADHPLSLDAVDVKKINEYIRQISLGINNSLLFQALKSNQETLEKANDKLEHISKHLGKYLSPQVVDQIVNGNIAHGATSQKKYLSVFMSDIVNFTQIIDKANAAMLNKELNIYLSEMTKIAYSFGGTVDKYMSDAIMVVFGDPFSSGYKNDALQCVLMAIKMAERAEELNKEFKVMHFKGDLKLRMGICSGFATVGNFGSDYHMDYTAIGTAVNLASRLHDIAEPNSIVVSDNTHSLISDHFKVIDYGKHKIKGFDEPLQTWKVSIHDEDIKAEQSHQTIEQNKYNPFYPS